VHKATDIVILVVCRDDSVMPQTIEAINSAKAAVFLLWFPSIRWIRSASPDKKTRNFLNMIDC